MYITEQEREEETEDGKAAVRLKDQLVSFDRSGAHTHTWTHTHTDTHDTHTHTHTHTHVVGRHTHTL